MAVRFPMYLVNQTIPVVVQMSPNPKNISIESAKIFSKTQTLGGWVFEHWGEQPQMIRVKGRTRGLRGNFENELGIEATMFQLQQLFRLDKREMLSLLPRMKSNTELSNFNPVKKWKDGTLTPEDLRTLSNTFIYYRYDVYMGFFTKFRWEQDAETSPRHYEYDFEFLATKTAQNMLADLLFTPSTVAGAATAAALGTAASVGAVTNAIKGIVGLGKNL